MSRSLGFGPTGAAVQRGSHGSRRSAGTIIEMPPDDTPSGAPLRVRLRAALRRFFLRIRVGLARAAQRRAQRLEGRRQLVRDAHDLLLLLAPFAAWGVALVGVYAASYTVSAAC